MSMTTLGTFSKHVTCGNLNPLMIQHLVHVLTVAVCVVCLYCRRVCPSESYHGEKETDSKGRTRLALRDPLVYPLQSGVCARRQPETRRKSPLSTPTNVQMKSFVIIAVRTFI